MIILIALILIGGIVIQIKRKQTTQPIEKEAPPSDLKEQFDALQFEIKKSSHYYQLLNREERVIFLKRAWVFYNQKRFEVRELNAVTFHMRALISSYAAQITFGLPEIRLKHFQTIIVYPSSYRSTITRELHKGEANPNGALVFSWKDLVQGHTNATDGINLALHEFAHALRLENVILNGESDFLNPIALKKFNELALTEMSKIRVLSNHFLRDYGATNEQEFFAVCVENFFERSSLFYEQLPAIYKLLTEILLQDPMRRPIRTSFN